MSGDRRPAGVAQAHPALVEMLESLLAEVPEADAEPCRAPPSAAVAEAAPDPTLKEVSEPPLQKHRQCQVHDTAGLGLDTPESRFSAILFGVGRYKFAVPLNMLDSVTRITGRPTGMFGQPGWHRGVVLSRERQLVLVDPGRLLGLADAEPVEPVDHVLVLPGGRYGILSSQAPEPVTLRGSGIRWSRPEARRPWLAAILPEHMCVMLDTEVLLELV
jgi:chemotaxis signal transduction protein